MVPTNKGNKWKCWNLNFTDSKIMSEDDEFIPNMWKKDKQGISEILNEDKVSGPDVNGNYQDHWFQIPPSFSWWPHASEMGM